jgi:hypothetical protein
MGTWIALDVAHGHFFLARGRSEEPTRFRRVGSLFLGGYPMRKPRPGTQMRASFAADHLAAASNEQSGWRVSVIESLTLARKGCRRAALSSSVARATG